jgi:S-adenosylhomocysteine hydrolase
VPRRLPQGPFATLARSTRPEKPAKQAGHACRTATMEGNMLLKGKICVITGAGSARGLGRATAMLFAAHGARFMALDINLAAAHDTLAALKGHGHMALRCDVTRRSRR